MGGISCMCVCMDLSLYVDSYDDVDIYDGHEAVLCVVCLGV